jgi:uncharacterized protein (TIGR03067 family)
MKNMTYILKSGFAAVLVAVAGCATAPRPADSAPAQQTVSAPLQGSWTGQEIGGTEERSASLAFSGSNLEFHGQDSNDWCKGTFSVKDDATPKQLVCVITDCPDAQQIGKTVNAIYKIENGELTITGNPPGSPDMPVAFDSQGARRLVLKPEKP